MTDSNSQSDSQPNASKPSHSNLYGVTAAATMASVSAAAAKGDPTQSGFHTHGRLDTVSYFDDFVPRPSYPTTTIPALFLQGLGGTNFAKNIELCALANIEASDSESDSESDSNSASLTTAASNAAMSGSSQHIESQPSSSSSSAASQSLVQELHAKQISFGKVTGRRHHRRQGSSPGSGRAVTVTGRKHCSGIHDATMSSRAGATAGSRATMPSVAQATVTLHHSDRIKRLERAKRARRRRMITKQQQQQQQQHSHDSNDSGVGACTGDSTCESDADVNELSLFMRIF
jgi:hypothetical protein